MAVAVQLRRGRGGGITARCQPHPSIRPLWPSTSLDGAPFSRPPGGPIVALRRSPDRFCGPREPLCPPPQPAWAVNG